jgi:hypothetical protein
MAGMSMEGHGLAVKREVAQGTHRDSESSDPPRWDMAS